MSTPFERELTPYARELLKSVSIPDLALGGLPTIKLLQSNSPDLLDSPDNPFHLPGSMAGRLLGSPPGREGQHLFLKASSGIPQRRLRFHPGMGRT